MQWKRSVNFNKTGLNYCNPFSPFLLINRGEINGTIKK